MHMAMSTTTEKNSEKDDCAMVYTDNNSSPFSYPQPWCHERGGESWRVRDSGERIASRDEQLQAAAAAAAAGAAVVTVVVGIVVVGAAVRCMKYVRCVPCPVIGTVSCDRYCVL